MAEPTSAKLQLNPGKMECLWDLGFPESDDLSFLILDEVTLHCMSLPQFGVLLDSCFLFNE